MVNEEKYIEGCYVESRLDKLELKLYELQYEKELQSSFMQESTRVMLSRTSIIIDILKASGIEQPNSMEKLQTAIKDLDKLINKTKVAITSSSDLWKLDSAQEHSTASKYDSFLFRVNMNYPLRKHLNLLRNLLNMILIVKARCMYNWK